MHVIFAPASSGVRGHPWSLLQYLQPLHQVLLQYTVGPIQASTCTCSHSCMPYTFPTLPGSPHTTFSSSKLSSLVSRHHRPGHMLGLFKVTLAHFQVVYVPVSLVFVPPLFSTDEEAGTYSSGPYIPHVKSTELIPIQVKLSSDFVP